MRFKCRVINPGFAKGEAIVSRSPVSLLGDINEEGVFEVGELKGESVAGKILIFPFGRGSTVGSYVLLKLKKRGFAPAAIVNKITEPIIAIGAIIAEIPLVDLVEEEFFSKVKSGILVTVNAFEGYVEL
uniref:phosphomevalonate dehydratase n=1 Tax=Archaeoglobus fulgidus TaxID=2234 RepID=A0A7J2TGN1_ARCFL